MKQVSLLSAVLVLVSVQSASAQKIYLAKGSEAIIRTNLDGTELETLVSVFSGTLTSLALDQDGGKMYWSERISGAEGLIRRANLDGSEPEDQVVGRTEVAALTIDPQARRLYWTEITSGEEGVFHANLEIPDGETAATRSDIEQVSSLANFFDIALLLPPSGTIPAVSSWGLVVMVLLGLVVGTVLIHKRQVA